VQLVERAQLAGKRPPERVLGRGDRRAVRRRGDLDRVDLDLGMRTHALTMASRQPRNAATDGKSRAAGVTRFRIAAQTLCRAPGPRDRIRTNWRPRLDSDATQRKDHGVRVILLVFACSGPEPTAAVGSGSTGSAPVPSKPAGAAPRACEDLAFAPTADVPEASGAAWLTLAGKPALLVISDSGNHGVYVILDAGDGSLVERGVLPLGDGSDDLEGIAARGDRFEVISSPGWIRSYQRVDHGFALVDGPYPLAAVEATGSVVPRPTRQAGGAPTPKGAAPRGDDTDRASMVCARTNCGRNYEGLCLAPAPAGPCVGFAASKADGQLYCVTEQHGRLAVVRAPAIRIARPDVIADCAFSADGAARTFKRCFGSVGAM
jgi:DNA-binding beta-propeller fold protein YncE